MKNRRMRQVKNVMKSVAVVLAYIVRKRVSDKYAVPLQIALSVLPLSKHYFKRFRQTFFFRERGIEIRQAITIWFQETTSCLLNIGAHYFRKRH